MAHVPVACLRVHVSKTVSTRFVARWRRRAAAGDDHDLAGDGAQYSIARLIQVRVQRDGFFQAILRWNAPLERFALKAVGMPRRRLRDLPHVVERERAPAVLAGELELVVQQARLQLDEAWKLRKH